MTARSDREKIIGILLLVAGILVIGTAIYNVNPQALPFLAAIAPAVTEAHSAAFVYAMFGLFILCPLLLLVLIANVAWRWIHKGPRNSPSPKIIQKTSEMLLRILLAAVPQLFILLTLFALTSTASAAYPDQFEATTLALGIWLAYHGINGIVRIPPLSEWTLDRHK